MHTTLMVLFPLSLITGNISKLIDIIINHSFLPTVQYFMFPIIFLLSSQCNNHSYMYLFLGDKYPEQSCWTKECVPS